MFQDWSFPTADTSNIVIVTLIEVMEAEFASMGEVWREHAEDVWTWALVKIDVDVQRRIPRASQHLGYPLLGDCQVARYSGPQRRIAQRDLTPELAHVRDFDPAQIRFSEILRWLEGKKVKDAREDLGGQKGTRREGVATRKQRAEELRRRIDFLVDRGNGRNARGGVMNDGLEMIESGFDPGKNIGKYGRLHVTLQNRGVRCSVKVDTCKGYTYLS
jgi:hypothetical protein